MGDGDIERAYRAARYCVDDPPARFTLRIGEHCAPLQVLLREQRVSAWAYVTACNPHSRLLAVDENAVRQRALLERVHASGWPALAGCAMADNGDWQEPSLLILGIAETDARALGRDFGQNAIVAGCAGSVARLVWCSP